MPAGVVTSLQGVSAFGSVFCFSTLLFQGTHELCNLDAWEMHVNVSKSAWLVSKHTFSIPATKRISNLCCIVKSFPFLAKDKFNFSMRFQPPVASNS